MWISVSWALCRLEIYLETADERYLNPGRDLADQQWEDPLPDGLTRETRWWVDDAFMIGSLPNPGLSRDEGPEIRRPGRDPTRRLLDQLQNPTACFITARKFRTFGAGATAGSRLRSPKCSVRFHRTIRNTRG